jgi:hypothetical protein
LADRTTWAAETREEIAYQSIYDDATAIRQHLEGQGEPGPFAVIPNFLLASDGDGTLQQMSSARPPIRGHSLLSFSPVLGLRSGLSMRNAKPNCCTEGKSFEELRWIEARYGHIPEFRDASIP